MLALPRRVYVCLKGIDRKVFGPPDTPFIHSSFLQHGARVVNAGEKRLSEAGKQIGDEMQCQGWGRKLKRGEVKKSDGGGGGGKWS